MHVLCSVTALISNCIYNFNLIISHARLINISAVRVAGANAELHSLRWSSPVPSRRSPVAGRHSSVVSPERSQLIFGSTLLLSTLCTPIPFAFPFPFGLRLVRLGFSSFGRLCRLLNDRRRATIHLQSVSKNVDGIIICCSWMLDCRWNPNILVPVPLSVFLCMCACVGLYLFNVEDCFVFCLKH